MTCLAQIILDPHYRTFEGIKTLIHKEWIFYKHDFLKKGLVLVDNKQLSIMQEETKDDSLMASAMSFFGKAKQDKTSILTAGHDSSVDPIFILFLDALNQLVSMNPLSFEFQTSYLTFIASELYTNRFWEFVQSGKEDDHAPLPSVFS